MVEVYRSFLLNRRNKFSIKGSGSENMAVLCLDRFDQRICVR